MAYTLEMIRSPGTPRRDDFNQSFVYSVALSGNLVMESSDEFSLLLNTLIAGGMRKVVLDLANVAYVDSTGIGIFINATKQLRSKGGDLAFVRVNPRVLSVLQLVKLHEFISFFETPEQVSDAFFRDQR